jgi:hypothetical protein
MTDLTKDPMCGKMDVIEVEIAAPHRVRVIATGKSERNAEAIVDMAVMRRGVDHHFFKTAPAGKYRDGDILPNA